MITLKSGLRHIHPGRAANRFALSLLVIMMASTAVVIQVNAQDLTAPTQVVNEYLSSLANGDTEKLVQLIDGRMKQNNKQLELNPASYSRFLKRNYAGVQMTIEEITANDKGVRARVRFDYPSQDSSKIELFLTESNGSWKITNEEYAN